MYLADSFDELTGQPLADLPISELTERLTHLDTALHRLHAEQLRLTASLTARASELDEPSPASLLRRTCRLSGRQAHQQLSLARALQDLPATHTALAAGQISIDHARIIAAATRGLPDPVVDTGEPTLIDAARTLDIHDTRRLAAHWRHTADPSAAERDHDRRHDARKLYASTTLNGMVALTGLLDPLAGATVLTALHALCAPHGPTDPRSPAQRRADALTELARRAMDNGVPDSGGVRPHLQVTIDLPALLGHPHTPGGELTWTGPVPTRIARLLGCDATITRIVLGPDSQPLDVGRATRLISPALRKALTLRDRTCTWPGCDTPAAWTDAHHIHHWADGGPTTLANLRLLCHRHHHAIHQHDPNHHTRSSHQRAGP